MSRSCMLYNIFSTSHLCPEGGSKVPGAFKLTQVTTRRSQLSNVCCSPGDAGYINYISHINDKFICRWVITMELVWEDPPVPEGPFFTRDHYDKYSLAPSVRELWNFLQSPPENAGLKEDRDVGTANALNSPSAEATELKDNSCISKESSNCENCDSDDQHADTSVDRDKGCTATRKFKGKRQVDLFYPEPRLPFPCTSSLSVNDQKTYVDILSSKKKQSVPQDLQTRVNNEVMQFTQYLQDVAKICAEDYNFISQGAVQYSEEFFRSCLEYIQTIPPLYQIHEMTSLTGGTFNPGLTLTFEKQLLIMGNVDITDHVVVAADTQLASDYQSVSSVTPPAKKAKDMHATISGDPNAANLSARYEPHVCLTQHALMRLLDNHGPEFGEQWELPVWIKLNTRKGSHQKKTVYVDSPLLKTEMTARERSHIYHEESLKLSINKKGSRKLFHLMTELPDDEKQLQLGSPQRNVVSFETNDLDFEMDFTDLETFGETASIKKSNKQHVQKEQDSNTSSLSDHHANTNRSSQEEMNTSLNETDDPMTEESAQPAGGEIDAPKTEENTLDCVPQSDNDQSFAGDSDNEKLIIDESTSPAGTSVTQGTESTSSQKTVKQRRQSKRARTSGDQLSEILRMQTAMFSSAREEAIPKETNSPTKNVAPTVPSHPLSLVKPCVSSYLVRNQSQDGELSAAPHETSAHKKILSQDLQASAEDEQHYQAPEEGNLIYKLYSLQDLLLLVRSSVSLTHTRRVGSGHELVPVHVLPKLEYQLSYGVECLSSSEACQLWTESLLHSSTVSYTGTVPPLLHMPLCFLFVCFFTFNENQDTNVSRLFFSSCSVHYSF
ncbi:uncharacterized protein V6R79_000383 [Siganus canaliculatus]